MPSAIQEGATIATPFDDGGINGFPSGPATSKGVSVSTIYLDPSPMIFTEMAKIAYQISLL